MTSIDVLRPAAQSNPARILVIGALFFVLASISVVAFLVSQGRAPNDWVSFYSAGLMLRTDAAHLYDASAQAATQHAIGGADMTVTGYPLPVFAAVIFAPLSRLSLGASYVVWFAINLALLGALLRLSWAWLSDTPASLRAVFLLSALVVTTRGVLLGQVDLFVLAGVVGCYVLLRSGRPFTAGCLLAIALFKPHLAGAVVLLLLVTDQRRALVGFAVVGGLLLTVPPLAVAPQLFVEQFRLLFSFSGATTGYGMDANIMINIRGAVTSLTGSSNVWLWLPPTAIVSAAAFYASIRVWLSRPALHPQSWALAFMLPLLYSPHLHMQSIILLAPAAGLYLAASQSSSRPVTDIKPVLYGLLAITVLWGLIFVGLSLMAFLIVGAFALFARRWPERAVSGQLSAIGPQPASALRAAG